MSVCRICLSEDEDSNMIAPCMCSGTNKFVHRECLENWCRISTRSDARTTCPNCRQHYEFEKMSWWDKMKSHGRGFLKCIYTVNPLVTIGIAAIEMFSIYPLSQVLVPRDDVYVVSNSTYVEPQIMIEMGRSLAAILIIVPISLTCFFWEVSATDSLDICSERFTSRFMGHFMIVLLASNWISAAAVFHAIGISRWFECLPNEAKWCKKPVQRHILDLNEAEDETV